MPETAAAMKVDDLLGKMVKYKTPKGKTFQFYAWDVVGDKLEVRDMVDLPDQRQSISKYMLPMADIEKALEAGQIEIISKARQFSAEESLERLAQIIIESLVQSGT